MSHKRLVLKLTHQAPSPAPSGFPESQQYNLHVQLIFFMKQIAKTS